MLFLVLLPIPFLPIFNLFFILLQARRLLV